jgi:AcrR family transcriptional regulator
MRPDQILDAAERVLVDGGADAMTMDAVAEAAGLGKGTIYHHYGSKAELLGAMRSRYLTRTVTRAAAAAREGRRGRRALGRVDQFLESIVQSSADNHELLWILFHQTGIEEEDELAGIHEELLALVNEGVQSGEFVLDDPDFTAGFLLHGFQGMTESAFHKGNRDVVALARRLRHVTRALLTH